jgi:hypothetical protein
MNRPIIKTRILAALLALGALAGFAGIRALRAGTVVYTKDLVNAPVLAYTTTYVLDLNLNRIDYPTFQAIYSSATVGTQTFNDGAFSTGTFTVVTPSALTLSTATDQLTLSTTNVTGTTAGDTITVNSTLSVTGMTLLVQGKRLLINRDFPNAGTTALLAASMAAEISAVTDLSAVSVGNIVFASAPAVGFAGNAYTISSSTTAWVVASPTLTGGADPKFTNAILTINGAQYQEGRAWIASTTANGTAISIANLLGNITGIISTASANVVYATATTGGAFYNTFFIKSSTPTITPAGITFTGGQDNATIAINGIKLVAGTDFTVGSANATATSIASAIGTNTGTSAIVSAIASGGVVYATATATGINYSLTTSTSPAITVSGPFTTGGTSSSYKVGSPLISVPAHGFGTALGLLYTSAATINPLSSGTTYYAIVVDPNDVELSLTSTGAVAGSFITLTSSPATTGDTFTLAPQSITGTPSLTWSVSNDGSTWYNIATSTLAFPSSYTANNVYWDFGLTNTHYLRLNETGPTAGAWNLVVRTNGKNSN